MAILLTNNDVLDYLIWWRFVEKGGVRFWMEPWLPDDCTTPARLEKARRLHPMPEIQVKADDFARLFSRQETEIGGVAVRMVDLREGVENAYQDGPPLDCYAPYGDFPPWS